MPSAPQSLSPDIPSLSPAPADSETHLRALMDSPTGFALYRLSAAPPDPHFGRVVLASPSLRDLLGIADPYCFNAWFKNIHPDDRPQ